MIERLYGKYFQKSKAFLYPMLGISKNSYTQPIETYIGLNSSITADEMKLICVFTQDNNSEGFKKFEEQLLVGNPLYDQTIESKEYKLYVFNFDMYKEDWFNFLLGKYSKLSQVFKRAIKEYYGEFSNEYKYMQTYIYPDKHHGVYAKLLDIDIQSLKETHELCDPCSIEKETLIIPVEELVLLEKTT